MTTFTVYAYFNVDQLATLMDSIAAISASGDFLDAFRVVVMLSFLVFVAGLAIGKAQDPFEFFRWLIIVLMVHSVLLIPKAEVILVDRTGSSPPTVRANVPIGLAFFASVTSHVGDTLTRMFETTFALPNDLQFQKNGMMFGNTVLVDSLQAVPTTPAFRDDLVKFINSCTYYDIIAGRINQNAFSRGDDIWAMMANTSNTLSTPISTSPTGSKICSDAYADLGDRWGAETTLTMQTRGRVLNPQSPNNVVAGALLSSQIGNSYTQLANISKSATDMLRQNMALNSVRDSQMAAAQRLDATSAAIVGAAQSQAEMTANTNYLAMARVAERAAPAVRNVVELICYAVFPLVVLLMIVAGEHAGKIFKAYVMSLVWIQLIPPLYALLNFAMTSTSRATLVGIAESTTAAAAVNLINIGQLSQRGLSETAIAGYLTLSLPLIAWMLVKGGEVGGAALFNAAMAPATSSRVADGYASGNISQGNVSLDTTASNNVNSNHYDTAPSMASGFTRVSSASGTSITGPGGVYRFQGNQSSLGLSANFGQKIGNALSSEAADRQELASRETTAASQMRTAALIERMGIAKAYGDQHGTSNIDDATRSSQSSEAISKLHQIAENVNEKLGLAASSSIGQRVVGTLAMGGGFELKSFIAGQLGLNSQNVTDAGKLKTLDSAIGFAKDQLRSSNVSSQHALSHDFRNSAAYQWGQQNRMDSVKNEEAALTTAAQHTRNAEVARSQAFSLSNQARTISEGWLHSSMDYGGYLAHRLHQDGTLEAFNMLYQTNPEQAARMAARYLSETDFDVMPTMPKISTNVQEVQEGSAALKGKSIETESTRLGTVPDGALQAYRRFQGVVVGHGYKQVDVPNAVRDLTEFAAKNTKEVIEQEKSVIVPGIESSKQQTADALARDKQIPGLSGPTGKPGKGSAAAQQDEVHRKLFGDEKNPKP